MKTAWITSLSKNEEPVSQIMGLAKEYGLQANGHFWCDDLKKLAWLAPKESLVAPDTSLWVIIGSEKDIGAGSVCYGLALLTIAVQAKKGNGFPIIWVNTEGEISQEKLPTPLRGAELLNFSNPALGAKMVAKINTPAKKISPDYRIDLHANIGFGVWFEIGPIGGQTWNGSLLGVQDAEINFHGVGSAGELPSKTVLEYPVKGMKLQLGDREYTAWAAQNKLDENNSYYIRVDGTPKSILFGPYSEDEETDVYIVDFYS